MTICDICELKIEKSIAPCINLIYRGDTKFELIRSKLDICDNCIKKLVHLGSEKIFKKAINE